VPAGEYPASFDAVSANFVSLPISFPMSLSP